MHFLIYPTERCNLMCKYCDEPEVRARCIKDRQYKTEDLLDFLKQAPASSVTFYGGEPTLDPEFMMDVMDRLPLKYYSLVTNTFFLEKLPLDYINRLNMISMSIDGRKETTDKNRGQGVHDMVMSKARWLTDNHYRGLKAARMTVSLGNDIEKDVKHLVGSGLFDIIHWQIDTFHGYTFDNPDVYKEWFDTKYNPGISTLVDCWVEAIVQDHEVLKIVPFMGIMYDLLTGRRQANIRCGAGSIFWAITTSGNIFPCPVLRNDLYFKISNIKDGPRAIQPKFQLKGPCKTCDIFGLCGGRCIAVNHYASDKPLFNVVCQTVRHLISELDRVRPLIQAELDKGNIKMDDFNYFFEHEVIP